MIVAGWVQQYRVHGVSLGSSVGKLSRAVVLGEAPNKRVVVVTFSQASLEPVYGPPHPRYAFVGDPTTIAVSTKNLASDHQAYASRGSWLLIEVMGTHAVSHELEAAFGQDPGQNSDPVLLEVRARLRLEAKPVAELAAGAYAARLGESILELVVDGPAVWAREARFLERPFLLEVLNATELDERTLAEVTPYIEAGLQAPTKGRRALELASHWYVRGRGNRPKP